jgi:hypothetical protein
MKRSLIPGFAASNLDDSFMASVICELDTIAMVTVFPVEPKEPAPAHPVRVRHAAAITAIVVRMGR